VYDLKQNFLDSFRSSTDLEEMSLTLNFPIKSRFSVDRGDVPLKYLQAVSINKAMRLGKPYKGLYFYSQPLHPGKDDVNEPKSVKS